MAPYAPFLTVVSPETAGGIVDLGEHGVQPGAETQNIVTTGLYRLHAYVPVEDIQEEKKDEIYGQLSRSPVSGKNFPYTESGDRGVPETQPVMKGAWKVGSKPTLIGFGQYSSLCKYGFNCGLRTKVNGCAS
jgi:hypothetical protein